MQDERNKLLRDAQLLALPGFNTETRSAFNKMIIAADELESNIELRKRVDATRPNPGDSDPFRTQDDKRALEHFIRYGIGGHVPGLEARDLGTSIGGSITAGAQFVPQAFYPMLTEAQKAWGAVAEAVNLYESENGAPMKIAFANDTSNVTAVLAEETQVSEVDPVLAGVVSMTDLLNTGLVKVSLQELQDSAFDIDKFVRDCFGKRHYRGLANLITNGSSTGNFGSIITGATSGCTSSTSGGLLITYADVIALFAALDPAYVLGATWSMNAAVRAVLLTVTDTLGRPLYIPSPTADSFDKLLGRPVILNQYQPNVGTSVKGTIMFGDFKQGYTLRVAKPGLAIVRLNERFMDVLAVGFTAYARCAGFTTDAGSHPIQYMTMHS